MSFPADLTLITVSGAIDEYPAGAASGTVTFIAPEWLAGLGGLVSPFTRSVDLDDDGEFSIVLPATDDPDYAPMGWVYTVRVALSSGRTETGTMALPWQDGSVEFAAAFDPSGAVPADAPARYVPLTSRGQANGVATLDGDALVPLAQIPAYEPPHGELLLAGGETVIRRGDVITSSPASTGTLYVTHFRAGRTEDITKIKTGSGGEAAVAVGATHAWIGILRWDGTNYVPVTESVDDPTRWTAQFATYNTPLQSTFHKVRGVDYALYVLWIGSGQAPSLAAGGGWFQDSLTEPRTNGLLFEQTQPPAAPLSGAFLGLDSRRFQAVLLP